MRTSALSSYRFPCSVWGEVHDFFAREGAYGEPEIWANRVSSQREMIGVLSSDQCVMDGQHFFIRACIPLKLQEHTDTWAWGVWASLTEGNYRRVVELWDTPGKEQEPSFASRIANVLPLELYPPTLNVKARLKLQPVGQRPLLELEPCEHPLYAEQANGVSPERAQAITEFLNHEWSID